MSEIETATEAPLAGAVLEPARVHELEVVGSKPRVRADSVAVRAADPLIGIGILIEKAIEAGRPIAELVDALKAAQEMKARQDYARAMFQFRRDCPPIPRARWVDMTGKNADYAWGFSYAPLDVIDEVVRPILGCYGLSYSFDQGPPDQGLIPTYAIVRHEGGHSERAVFYGPRGDNPKLSGGQNNAAGNSFNKRQALISVLGLVTTDNFDNEQALTMMQGVNGQPPAQAVKQSIKQPQRRQDAAAPRQYDAKPMPTTPPREQPASQPPAGEFVSDRQLEVLRRRIDLAGIGEAELCRRFEVPALEQLPRAKVNPVLEYLAKLVS